MQPCLAVLRLSKGFVFRGKLIADVLVRIGNLISARYQDSDDTRQMNCGRSCAERWRQSLQEPARLARTLATIQPIDRQIRVLSANASVLSQRDCVIGCG